MTYYMKLREYVRGQSVRHLIPLFKKDKCEACGTEERLEWHHVIPFAQLLSDCLEVLGYDNKDVGEYTENQLYNIDSYMLGSQIIKGSMTLCKNCHMKLHGVMGGFSNATDNARELTKLYYEKQRVNNKIKESDRYIEIVEPFLEQVEGISLCKNDKEPLIQMINCRKDGKQQRSYAKLNEKLTKMKSEYRIIPKRTCSGRYWIVKKM